MPYLYCKSGAFLSEANNTSKISLVPLLGTRQTEQNQTLLPLEATGLSTPRTAQDCNPRQLPPPTGVAQDLPSMVCWPGRQQDQRHLVTQHTPFLGSSGTPRVKEETSLSGPMGSLEGIAGSG